MNIYYIAHPVRPCGQETLSSNLGDVERYLSAFSEAGVPVIAPYVSIIRAIGETEVNRQWGLKCMRELITRLDGVILVGYRITDGMDLEAMAAKHIYNCTFRAPAVAVQAFKRFQLEGL